MIVQGIEPWIMLPQNKAFQLSLSYTNHCSRAGLLMIIIYMAGGYIPPQPLLIWSKGQTWAGYLNDRARVYMPL